MSIRALARAADCRNIGEADSYRSSSRLDRLSALPLRADDRPAQVLECAEARYCKPDYLSRGSLSTYDDMVDDLLPDLFAGRAPSIGTGRPRVLWRYSARACADHRYGSRHF